MRKIVSVLGLAAFMLAGPATALAQVRQIDPNRAIDGDLAQQQQAAPASSQYNQTYPAQQTQPQPPAYQDPPPQYQDQPAPYQNQAAPSPQDNGVPPPAGADAARAAADRQAATATTFNQQELFAAAEGTFGKGAAGLAGILERTLREQGEPNAYIAGSEASGAIGIGLRYGKGQMFHKVEGQRSVFWQGPSLGFDLGGDADKVFVLVYNLYDTEDIFKRFPAVEGRLYFVGGFAATYLRRGNIVLIPIRLGVGWRQGVNIGYMKFTHKSRWFPF